MNFKKQGKHNRIKTSAQRKQDAKKKAFKQPPIAMTTTDNHSTQPTSTPSVAQEDQNVLEAQLERVRNCEKVDDFNAFITDLSASQESVSKMMGVLLPGHKPARELIQAVWEGLYAHYTEEDWKLSDFNSLSSTMQRLTSMQNQLDTLEMRRLEFARDHKDLVSFSQHAIKALREHSGELSPEALERIEQSLKIF